VRKADNLATFMYLLSKIWETQPPGTPWACNRPEEGLFRIYRIILKTSVLKLQGGEDGNLPKNKVSFVLSVCLFVYESLMTTFL